MIESLQNSAGAGSSVTPPKSQSELGSDDFLKLMITQFQNQDPFSPMESGEFMGQLAQFTSASGIGELQKSFERFAEGMRGDQGLRAANLVGRHVMVDGGLGFLPQEGGMGGSVQLPSGVEKLTVRIHNQMGELVRELPLGTQGAGDVHFGWDGNNDKGERLPPGRYEVSASGTYQGDNKSLNVLMASRVTSVALGSKGESPSLSLEGLGERSLSAVRHIL